MVDHLIAKAKQQKGGVFLWQEDWDAIVRKLRQMDSEINSFRKMLHDHDSIRFNEMGRTMR